MIRQTFTRAGNEPDQIALGAAIRATIGDPFYCSWRSGFVDIEKPSVWTAPQITAVQAAIVACADRTVETDAQTEIDNWPISVKAFALALIDQLNVIRAALPTPLGAITPAQALAAIRAKAGTL